jgi:murein DD-endopeptidase MepM/ murein hydrolase activator NlpD
MNTRQYLYVGIGLTVAGVVIYAVVKKMQDRTMIMPVNGPITSPFGARIHPISGEPDFHNGIDIKAATGDKIIAPANGVVKSQYFNDAGGNQMLIEHDNGYTTGYAHLSKYLVKQGDRVKKGQAVAEVGNTGNSTGSHLHLTLKDSSGTIINPINHFV